MSFGSLFTGEVALHKECKDCCKWDQCVLCKINKCLALQVAGMRAREVQICLPACLSSSKETGGEKKSSSHLPGPLEVERPLSPSFCPDG